jgi:hypothetical protein
MPYDSQVIVLDRSQNIPDAGGWLKVRWARRNNPIINRGAQLPENVTRAILPQLRSSVLGFVSTGIWCFSPKTASIDFIFC